MLPFPPLHVGKNYIWFGGSGFSGVILQKPRLNEQCCAQDHMVPCPGGIAVSVIKDPDWKELSSYFQVRVGHSMRVKATAAEQLIASGAQSGADR